MGTLIKVANVRHDLALSKPKSLPHFFGRKAILNSGLSPFLFKCSEAIKNKNLSNFLTFFQSSPELLQLPLMTSQSTSSGLPALSATPSPLPTNELSLLSPMPAAKCQQLLNSANGQLNYLSSSSSLQSLKAQQSLPLSNNAGKHFRRPKVSVTGNWEEVEGKQKTGLSNC